MKTNEPSGDKIVPTDLFMPKLHLQTPRFNVYSKYLKNTE